jgi:asparagine synthetase B (glutamine-hydrolysing)
MCGIFGVIVKSNSQYNRKFIKEALTKLALLSESRGKDSSGLCLLTPKDSFEVIKGPVPVSKLIKNIKVNNIIEKAIIDNNKTILAFGHARLVTNGTQLNDANNQPVIKDGIIGVHNGIIVNVDDLWDVNKEIQRENEIDTEVMLALVRNNLNKGKGLKQAVSDSVNSVFGTVATAMAFNDLDKFVLATNNGSLYTIHNNKDILFFASEKYMLSEFEKKINLKLIGDYTLKQIQPNKGVVVSFQDDFIIEEFSLQEALHNETEKYRKSNYQTNIKSVDSEKEQLSTVVDLNLIHLNSNAKKERELLIYPIEKIKQLRRCTKCLLPETFPFIEYDNQGVCNYCHNYKKKDLPKTLDDLAKLVEPYRNANGLPEVLIPLSGGRDSTYVLHIVRKELGLNAVAFTYDWGMVTDLARRNVARICGKLGVENIIVAADIHWKRANIRKNIKAWLKKPELGMIPLFMAGDKFFFYYAHKVKKQLGINLEIWGVNELENTNFKTGFAGLKPQFDKERIYSLSLRNKMKLFGFVAKNVINSPGYINQSVIDSLGSFASRYFTSKADYYHLFDFVEWNEKRIENTILNEYSWEKAYDTESTWRIGDGTASFYNYIYTLVAGFSENDTFRSNQIREGMITRDQGLKLIYEENKPRYNSLKWYLEIIGLDFESTIRKINQIPVLY